MPALPSNVVLDTLLKRNVTQTATNNTSPVLHVICGFTLSGQYGPGSRYLYYVLITACLVGRKSELLKQVCLAAALIFPAVAAIHAVVLAALHNDGIVDMDIFGAFQLCSVGILVAPLAVQQSTYYWKSRGKKLILPWAILIVTGLLSLIVEFCRTKTHPCPYDNTGQSTSTDPRVFNYTSPPNCSITCSSNSGPFSPIRQGGANNIFLVPAPDRITFGMGALFSAGCCIPPVIYLVYMWIKILEKNWEEAFAVRKNSNRGTNLTPKMKRLQRFLRWQPSVWIGALVICLAVLGELNFYSPQVLWQSEPFSAIGQWATVIGPTFAVAGALFIEEERQVPPIILKIGCWIREIYRGQFPASPQDVVIESAIVEGHSPSQVSGRASTEVANPPTSQAVSVTEERGSSESQPPVRRTTTNRLLTPKPDTFPNDEESKLKGNQFPESPNEGLYNPAFLNQKAWYEKVSGGAEGSTTPLQEPSRPPSSTSVTSEHGNALGIASTSRSPSPRRQTLPDEGTSSEPAQTRLRRDTLDVPPRLPSSRRLSGSSRTSGC